MRGKKWTGVSDVRGKGGQGILNVMGTVRQVHFICQLKVSRCVG